MDYKFSIPCLFGLESLIADEMKHLGFKNIQSENGRVGFTGGASGIARANINCRFGERVLIEIGGFRAETFDQFFEGVKALPWENFITADGAFPIKGSSRASKLHSIPDCQAIVKKAIVERLKGVYNIEWFGETGPKYQVQFMLAKDIATLYIDTTGPGLHKRGYRSSAVAAPLRETLAAALVKLSRWHGDRMLIDPFCGSGTIPIESAMIAGNVAPGMFRRFAAQKWENIPSSIWADELNLAKDEVRPTEQIIFASDLNPASVALAEDNARKAGVASLIEFSVADALETDLSAFAEQGGYLVSNPPYGERISDVKDVEDLYRAFAAHLKQYPSLKAFILSNHADFENFFGRADRRRKLYNGMIICNLYSYFGRTGTA